MIDVTTLRKGDAVTYTEARSGRSQEVTVQSDPETYGAHGSRSVTIGYGPGRWNRSVSNDGQTMGFYRLSSTSSTDATDNDRGEEEPMAKCPYRDCTFTGTEEEVDEHRATGVHDDEPQGGSNR